MKTKKAKRGAVKRVSADRGAVDHGAAAKQYIAGVLDGKIVVGRYVRLAVQRHQLDLDKGADRGLWFDELAACRAIRFFAFLRHSKGEWGRSGGQRFILSPWQAFNIWCVFGWKRTDDGSKPTGNPKKDRPRSRRRFRVAYEEIARKNGKSTFAAGVGLYGLVGDGEPGAEIYCAATKRDQAKLVWDEAARMVKKSPPLRAHVDIASINLSVEETSSKFEPLSADADSMDGLNVHIGILDELHQHKTRGVWDSIDTATGARRQPLLFSITTAGVNRFGVCYEERDYSIKILEAGCGVRTDIKIDDSRFVFIATLDERDDWKDEKNWPKANPNLGISVKLDDLRAKAIAAEMYATKRNAFLTKHLNIWCDQTTAWINMSKWDACAAQIPLEQLARRVCYGAFDLSHKIDLTAWVKVFPPIRDDPFWRIVPRFWIPEDTAAERERLEQMPYRDWKKKGLVEFTPGNVVDYEFAEKAVIDDAKNYQLLEIGFDPWDATATANRLAKEGLALKEVRQGAKSLSAACKEFERLIVAGKIAHGGHELLRWNASCVEVKSDESGNIRPVKPEHNQGSKRIDGIVAAVMAIALAINSEVPEESAYEQGPQDLQL